MMDMVINMIEILVIEDDRHIAELVKTLLNEEGYRCVCCYDGKEAVDIITHQSFDLIILDIMLPHIDGYELIEYIKPTKTPFIILSAKNTENDYIKGINYDADFYIKKPFSNIEFVANVKSSLRRHGKLSRYLTFADISIDTFSRIVKKNDSVIELTPKEYDLFLYLLQNKNIALYKDQIYEAVWHDYYIKNSRTIDLHIQRIRKKLGLNQYIITVHHIGYRLEDHS